MNGNITFVSGDATEIMRLSKEGITVNPDIPVDAAAQKVLEMLGNHIKHIVDIAVKAEREACAELCEELRDEDGYECWGTECAVAIRARRDMSTKSQNIDTSAEHVHEIDKSIHEPWDTSDMAHRTGGLRIDQEPVAWMYVNEDGECEQIEYGVSTVEAPYITLLYTAPPSKEWVSLTEEESSDIYNAHHNTYGECITSADDLVLDIEAALRSKNDPSSH